MRRFGVSVTLLVLVTIASGCHHGAFGDGGEEPTQDALGRKPSDLVSTWVEMWNSYELDQVGELFLTDDRVTYFSSEFEGVIQGFDAVLEHHRGFGFTSGGAERGTRRPVIARLPRAPAPMGHLSAGAIRGDVGESAS